MPAGKREKEGERVTEYRKLGRVAPLALALIRAGCSTKPAVAASPTAPGPTTSTSTPSTAPASPRVIPPGCRPDGSKLQISTSKLQFSTRCLAAHIGAPFTIVLDNKASPTFAAPHNLSIYTDSTASQSLFEGAQVAIGDRVTYHVPELAGGTYFFRCDTHPRMFGVFVVR
jgi:hypothetical protein